MKKLRTVHNFLIRRYSFVLFHIFLFLHECTHVYINLCVCTYTSPYSHSAFIYQGLLYARDNYGYIVNNHGNLCLHGVFVLMGGGRQ